MPNSELTSTYPFNNKRNYYDDGQSINILTGAETNCQHLSSDWGNVCPCNANNNNLRHIDIRGFVNGSWTRDEMIEGNVTNDVV